MAVTELRKVSKVFGTDQVIEPLDLFVESGEFLVVVGPSGCGKSTMLKMIAGLEPVSEGSILIDGEDVTRKEPSDRGIAMVFQTYALYPHMTVRANMSFALEMAGINKARRQQLVEKAAKTLQLTEYLDRKPRQLSGGQRQRVAIGRAIVRNPKVFLFDEPLSNLDAELRVQMRLEIARLHRELGATIVYVTHDQVEAMTLATRIAVLRDGRLEQVGLPADLYSNPCNTFVARFIGSPRMNLLPAMVHRRADAGYALIDVPRLGLERYPVPLASPGKVLPKEALFGVRPEDLVKVSEDAHQSFSLNCELVEDLGSSVYLYSSVVRDESIVAALPRKTRPPIGTSVNFQISGDSTFLFTTDGMRL